MTDKPTKTEVAQLIELGAATLYEAAGAKGALDPALKPIDAAMKFAGPAFTVEAAPGDNLAIHLALAEAKAGDVIIVDGRGFLDIAFIGDVMAVAAQSRGVAAMVIDGAVRDAVQIAEMKFPVFARGLCIRGPGKAHKGTRGNTILCGGLPIAPGDILVGDRDGIVAIEARRWRDVLAKAREREAKEAGFKEQLKKGKTTVELLGLKA